MASQAILEKLLAVEIMLHRSIPEGTTCRSRSQRSSRQQVLSKLVHVIALPHHDAGD